MIARHKQESLSAQIRYTSHRHHALEIPATHAQVGGGTPLFQGLCFLPSCYIQTFLHNVQHTLIYSKAAIILHYSFSVQTDMAHNGGFSYSLVRSFP